MRDLSPEILSFFKNIFDSLEETPENLFDPIFSEIFETIKPRKRETSIWEIFPSKWKNRRSLETNQKKNQMSILIGMNFWSFSPEGGFLKSIPRHAMRPLEISKGLRKEPIEIARQLTMKKTSILGWDKDVLWDNEAGSLFTMKFQGESGEVLKGRTRGFGDYGGEILKI